MMGTPGSGTEPWQYPSEPLLLRLVQTSRHNPSRPTGISSPRFVDRLRVNPHTKDHDLQVDVKQSVVILTGKVSSAVAKRAAGDDAGTPPGSSMSVTS